VPFESGILNEQGCHDQYFLLTVLELHLAPRFERSGNTRMNLALVDPTLDHPQPRARRRAWDGTIGVGPAIDDAPINTALALLHQVSGGRDGGNRCDFRSISVSIAFCHDILPIVK
jgi:hypothetical protein